MKKRKYAHGHYLRNEIITSKAFTELAKQQGGGSAIQVYLVFLLKLNNFGAANTHAKKKKDSPLPMYNAGNHRELQFTFREAMKLGFYAGRFNRAIDLLVKYGFIDIPHTGMGLRKEVTIYAISDRWEKYDTAVFKIVKRRKSTQYNHGFKDGNDVWKRSQKQK